jgi:hypothetical protein
MKKPKAIIRRFVASNSPTWLILAFRKNVILLQINRYRPFAVKPIGD